ncbi:MAG: hypothetical protein QG673_1203, partial [Pseudomonadota bacterium]|nr:hypothetical protein [Pseudomonadota bacterium]
QEAKEQAQAESQKAQAAVKSAKAEAMQLGEEKGRQEVARSLLKSGMDESSVAAATNLTLAQIQSLR